MLKNILVGEEEEEEGHRHIISTNPFVIQISFIEISNPTQYPHGILNSTILAVAKKYIMHVDK